MLTSRPAGIENSSSNAAPVSRAWLAIDPAFEPVRRDTRFQRLAAGT